MVERGQDDEVRILVSNAVSNDLFFTLNSRSQTVAMTLLSQDQDDSLTHALTTLISVLR